MFPEKNSNVMCELFCEKGRPMDEVFAEADEVFEETIETPYQEHVHLETNSAIADMEDGKFVFYASAQCPFYIRKSIAGLLDIPYDDIIVRPVHDRRRVRRQGAFPRRALRRSAGGGEQDPQAHQDGL